MLPQRQSSLSCLGAGVLVPSSLWQQQPEVPAVRTPVFSAACSQQQHSGEVSHNCPRITAMVAIGFICTATLD